VEQDFGGVRRRFMAEGAMTEWAHGLDCRVAGDHVEQYPRIPGDILPGGPVVAVAGRQVDATPDSLVLPAIPAKPAPIEELYAGSRTKN
jgi:hypothetical protein